MRYGDDKTIHGTQHLDVEVDKAGSVVSVWFRCMMLPFEVTVVDDNRAQEMQDAYNRPNNGIQHLNAVIIGE